MGRGDRRKVRWQHDRERKKKARQKRRSQERTVARKSTR
jgi:hypothetical protein